MNIIERFKQAQASLHYAEPEHLTISQQKALGFLMQVLFQLDEGGYHDHPRFMEVYALIHPFRKWVEDQLMLSTLDENLDERQEVERLRVLKKAGLIYLMMKELHDK